MIFVSPINTITLDCSGNVLPNAILLADIDGNKNNELLVGTQEGELLIFKVFRGQNNAQLWRRGQGLGFITAVTVGQLTTSSTEYRPIICVANAEGAIHLFVLRANSTRSRVRSAGGTISSGSRNDSKLQLQGSSSSASNDDEQQQIQVAFSQQLICNPKCLIIQEFNDYEKQLIIGYSNRIIRIFTSMITEDSEGRLAGRFILKHVYNIAGHICTLNSRRLSTKDYELVVSQPGGNLLRFNPNEEKPRVLATDMCSNSGETGFSEAVALEKFGQDVVYAAISGDRIDIFHSQLNRIIKTISSVVKTGYLCSLKVGPTTKDDYDQLVTVSSVDGDTFIVDQHGNLTCFRPPLSSNTGCAGDSDSIGTTNFFDQIQAFTCGLFGDNNMFCFIYVLTHNDKIMIVHSIEITNTNTKNLLAILDEKYEDVVTEPEKLRDILHSSH